MSIAKYPPAYGHSLNAQIMKLEGSEMGPNEPIFSPQFIERYDKPVANYGTWEYLWTGEIEIDIPKMKLSFSQFVHLHGYITFVNNVFTTAIQRGNSVSISRLQVDRAYTRCMVNLFDDTEQKDLEYLLKLRWMEGDEIKAHYIRRRNLKKAMNQRVSDKAEKFWAELKVKHQLSDDDVKPIKDEDFIFHDIPFDDMNDDNDVHNAYAYLDIINEEKGDPDEYVATTTASEDGDVSMGENEGEEDMQMDYDDHSTFFSGLTDRTRPE